MATIAVTGIDASFRVPGQWIEVMFNQGQAGGAVAVREVCFLTPMTASGTGVANTKYECKNLTDVETYAGAGSPAYRAGKIHFSVPGSKRFWIVTYAATSGGGVASALKTITVGGTITGSGTCHVYVCGEDCSFTYASTNSTSDIGAGLRASINNKYWLPVTGAGSTTSVVPTARIAGASGNTAIKVRTLVEGSGGATLSGDGDCAGGAEGATAEATNLTAALAAIAATSGLYYLCWGGAQAAGAYACFTAVKTALSTRSAANPGLRAVGIVASRDTLVNTTTMANALNYERVQMVWQENAEQDPATLVGQVAAIRAAHENTDSAYNFAGYGMKGEADWQILPTYADSDWPTVAEQNTAITEGITPIASTSTGTYLVLSVNTRAKTSSVYDFRSTETHRVSVADDFASTLGARWTLNYSGKKLRDDVKLANGTVDPNQKRAAGIITPSQVRADLIVRTFRDFYNDGKIQEVDTSIANAVCQKSSVNNARIEFMADVHAIDHANQFLGKVNEVSTD